MKPRVWEKIQRNKRRREEAEIAKIQIMNRNRHLTDEAFHFLNSLLNPKKHENNT